MASNKVTRDSNGKGYTRNEITAYFDKVRNRKNWKNPINRLVDAADVAPCIAAIGYFTGGGGVAIREAKSGKYRIKAPGYYASIGA